MRVKHLTSSLLGRWHPVLALCSPPGPSLSAERTARTKLAIECCKAGAVPLPVWQDIADVLNWIQSAKEIGLLADAQGLLEDAKKVLVESSQGTLGNNTSCVYLCEDFLELVSCVSATTYWKVVRHSEKRHAELWAGKVRKGDVLLQL